MCEMKEWIKIKTNCKVYSFFIEISWS